MPLRQKGAQPKLRARTRYASLREMPACCCSQGPADVAGRAGGVAPLVCARQATMVVRRGADGKAQRAGEQVLIGGNDVYVSLCRRHWREEMGDVPEAVPPARAVPTGGE